MQNKRAKLYYIVLLLAMLTFACRATSPDQQAAPTSQPTPKVAQPTSEFDMTSLTTNEEAILVDLYNRVNPSVVSILVYSDEGGLSIPVSQGSGFVYDDTGHIVTNAHVVHGASDVNIAFSDATIRRANIVGEDLHSDLAVLKTELPEGILPLPLADIQNVAVGQTVVAIGNPFGLGGTLTRGIVSALGRTIPALTTFSIPQAIQTDAPINPGNSGGPLLNLKGEVIGVNAQIETDGENRTNSGIGFAIPVSIISRVIPELITNGEYIWSWMGVRGGSVNPLLVDAMNLPVERGAYLYEVISGGPAEKAGLKGADGRATVDGQAVETGGDVIIAVDGIPVNSFDDMLIYIALYGQPGKEVTVTIVRDGKTQDIKVILEPRPSDMEQIQLP